MMRYLGCLTLTLFLISCESKITADLQGKKPVAAAEKPLKQIDVVKLIDSLKLDRNKIVVHVDKSEYIMRLKYDTLLLKSYPVVFGFNAIDDKLKQGDGCTPEGTFGIRSKYPHAAWSKFIWIDYPNKDSWAKHKQAKINGAISKNAAIGGEVGIHGVPAGYDYIIEERQNWTLGCISLTNKDVNELYEAIGPKTKIVVTK